MFARPARASRGPESLAGWERKGRAVAKNVIGFNWIGDREGAPLFIFERHGTWRTRAEEDAINGKAPLSARELRFSPLSASSAPDSFRTVPLNFNFAFEILIESSPELQYRLFEYR